MADVVERLKAALADRYRIERELGAGGMATVYLAEDLKHHRPVAIKVLRPELAATLGPARFLREVQLAARLQHPHILTLLDSGEAAGFLYYVMPCVEGESLRTQLTREGTLSLEQVATLARAIAAALDYAHRHGVIHRDVKPENILLHEGEPMVADFGIALAVQSAGDDRLTEAGMNLGTPAYMSPEQVTGVGALDGRSDQYSLGCLVYELLSGEPPYRAPTAHGVCVKHVTEAVPGLRSPRGPLPGAAVQAVTRALAKDPAARYGTVGEFAAALQMAQVAPSATRDQTSIVVLPFDNLSPDPRDAYLADGLTEELTADLARVSALRVTARNSAMAAKRRTQDLREVAELLKVRYVLEGSVRRAGNVLRITAQLIDGTTDSHVWTEKYSGTMDDVFDLQEKLSRTIVEALTVKLTRQESRRLAVRPVRDVRAFECYLQARQLIWQYDPAAQRQAESLLHQAFALMPDSALLHATLAWLHFHEYNLGVTSGSEAVRRSAPSTARALALDPECALAWTMRGLEAYVLGKEAGVREAIPYLRRAVELEPEVVTLSYLVYCSAYAGLEQEATTVANQLRLRDPLGPVSTLYRAYVPLWRGDFTEFAATIERAAQLGAPAFNVAMFRALAALYQGHVGNARGCLPAMRTTVAALPGGWSASVEAFGAMLDGDRDGVLQWVLEGREFAWDHADLSLRSGELLAQVGATDEALEWLAHAVFLGFSNWRFLASRDSLLAPLHGHPRFEAIVADAKRRQAEFLALHGERSGDHQVTAA